MLNRLKIKQAVIVEGLNDKALLESVIDGTVIYVNGFGIYKDKAKLALIRLYAEIQGLILLTDSDNAGRQIRDFLKSRFQGCQIHHIYVPNLLEVEDTAVEILRGIFEEFNNYNLPKLNKNYDRQRLFNDGFIGIANAAGRRKALLKSMNLPENLSVTALLDVLNRCNSEDYDRFVNNGGGVTDS